MILADRFSLDNGAEGDGVPGAVARSGYWLTGRTHFARHTPSAPHPTTHSDRTHKFEPGPGSTYDTPAR